MKPEPRIRKDGLCYVCKEERPEAAVKDGDPFCSNECCKRYQGILPKTKAADGRRMPTKAETAKRTKTRKATNEAKYTIRGKRSDRVDS